MNSINQFYSPVKLFLKNFKKKGDFPVLAAVRGALVCFAVPCSARREAAGRGV
ncbi:MAG: hypothetical protein LBC67_03785 [Spirochaetales bacterium]|jgi:hypothetical protein|nr:hypothetical protein [Spirochaetales bacterium]